MTIERTTQGWRCSDIDGNERVSMHYIGYTKKEAQRLFRQVLRNRAESRALNHSYIN